ncbi:MAG: universal stress protein [Syntrophales bacterium]|nr:universal stress protein [Syntrophales bacterium]
MNKRVVVAVDLREPSSGAVTYALSLAGRLQTPLILLAVTPPPRNRAQPGADPAGAGLPADQKHWLDQAVKQGRDAGVSLELFLATGPFSQAILEFVGSRGDIQFLVMAAGETGKTSAPLPALSLSRLHQVFPGEILLVKEQDRVTNLSEMPLKNKGRES